MSSLDLCCIECQGWAAEEYEPRIAELEAENERLKQEKTRVIQCNIYRLPVIALDVETGEQGVHWIDGYSTAEVLAVVHDDVPAPVYESVPKSVSESWVEADLAAAREEARRWEWVANEAIRQTFFPALDDAKEYTESLEASYLARYQPEEEK